LLYIQPKGRDLLQKEVRAIKKLCGPGAHVNIVQVLDHGQLSNTPYYFIDMEFCDLNLHDYIHRETSPEPSESIPYFIKGAGATSSLQIWIVMSQIAAGVKYIHEKGHVHRDIKPANGAGSLLYY
jgi:serine/threonine protein kinase